MKYPIAKSDRIRSKPTPTQIAKRRRKWYRKNRAKILKRRAIRRWESAHLPPEQWTHWDISQRVELCSQCRIHKPVCQFIRGFTRICIMCRHPNMPPIDNTHLTYPV